MTKKELRIGFYKELIGPGESAEFINVEFPSWFFDMRTRCVDKDVKQKLKEGKYKVVLIMEDDNGQ